MSSKYRGVIFVHLSPRLCSAPPYVPTTCRVGSVLCCPPGPAGGWASCDNCPSPTIYYPAVISAAFIPFCKASSHRPSHHALPSSIADADRPFAARFSWSSVQLGIVVSWTWTLGLDRWSNLGRDVGPVPKASRPHHPCVGRDALDARDGN